MRKEIAILLLAALVLAACQNSERERELLQREQILLEKEKQFARKEADYQILQKLRDSLQNALALASDTLRAPFVLPQTIAGQWTGKVVCTASNCPDYVVGDQRNDTWEFGQDSSQVLVKVLNNNTLVRVYTGTYDGSLLVLGYKTDSTAAKQVEMQVTLNDIRENKIRGTRAIMIDGRCNASFTVDLDRIKSIP